MSDTTMSYEQIMKLANTPAGKQLLALLRSSGGTAVQQAQEHAKQGDFRQAQQALSKLMQSQQVQKLIQEMRDQNE